MTINIRKAYIFFLCVYFICLPLGAMNIGVFGSALKLLSIIPIGLALLNIKSFKTSRPLNWYFIYLLIVFFSLLISNNKSDSISKAISIFQLFLLMATTGCFRYSENDILTIKNVLKWSSRISVVVVLIFGTYKAGRLWLSNNIINEDPNYFCMYLSFGCICALQCLMKRSSLKIKIFSVLELFIYLMVALLTGSRGGLIALVIGIITFIVFASKKNMRMKNILYIAIVLLLLYIGMGLISDTLADRFTIQSIVESGGTHRTDLWLQGWDLFINGSIFRKLFGYGIATTMYNFKLGGYTFVNVMHNMFIESLVELGIIGFIVYTIMVFTFLKYAYKNNEKFAFAVMVCMIAMSLSTSISSFKPYINIMMFILCTNIFSKYPLAAKSEKTSLNRNSYVALNRSTSL